MPQELYLNMALNFLLGVAVASYGTLVGAGGGFLLVPIFLLLHKLPHAEAVGTSLFIVVANALSGTLGYLRERKIDFRAGAGFALATLPGAVLGALSTSLVSGPTFQKVFGIVMSLAAIYLLLRKGRAPVPGASPREGPGWVQRTLHSENGTIRYSYWELPGLGISVIVGAISSWSGIGGGIIHVPLMVEFLGFPVAVAVATSQFILSFTAVIGAVAHFMQGHLNLGIAVPAALGALVGAQLGVRIARRVQGGVIIKALALALLLVGVRLIAN